MNEEQAGLLIVDDEVAIRKLLTEKFSREGYRCWECGNAIEASHQLEINPIALVILDIRMPGKSGMELLPEIKALSPDTAVVVATALDDTGMAVECMKAGADDFLLKPFNLENVALRVKRALANRRLELENREYRLAIQSQLSALDNLADELTRMRDEFRSSISRAEIQEE